MILLVNRRMVIWCLCGWLGLGCGEEAVAPAPVADTVSANDTLLLPPDEDGQQVTLGPLPYVPMKEVGNPTHISTEAIALVDVSEELGLPTGRAESVNFVDFDDDGWPDLTVVAVDGLTLYRNLGGVFEDATNEVLATNSSVRMDASQVTYGDVDGDGDLDMYVASRNAPDRLLFNNGYGQFLEPATLQGIPEALSVQGVFFSDIDGDQDLDIYVTRGRRVSVSEEGPKDFGLEGSPNQLLLNQGGDSFQDVTVEWNAVAGDLSETFGAAIADFDRDGDPDALVVRDFDADHYLRNEQGKTFVDATTESIDVNTTNLMGVAIGDYNGDGHIDIYSTNVGSDYLYKGLGDGRFENVFEASLTTADPSFLKTGWGCAFVDLDNDGDQDVISVANYQLPGENGDDSVARLGGYMVLENLGGGSFQDVTEAAGLSAVVNGYALAVADYDLDGDLDVVVGLWEPVDLGFGPDISEVVHGVRLLRNDSARGAGHRFLELSLRAATGNRFAVGAIVDVRAGTIRSSRVVTAGESFLSQHNPVQHFGLGTRTVAERVQITWPDGVVTVAHQVPAGYRRLAPYSGDCCYPEQTCETAWPDCPVWLPEVDDCGQNPGCELCEEVCARLESCGELSFDCQAECEDDPPSPAESACVLSAECSTVMDCLVE